MRRSTLIPAVLAILVLNACAQREGASLPTGGVLPMPVAQGDIWKAVAPFVAGKYAGGCARIPEMDIGDATIEVGLDGKLTAPGTGIGLRQQRLVSLTRKTKDGVLTVAAMPTTHGEPGATLNLLDAGKPEGAAATLMNADHELDCPHGAPLLKLRSQPLYRSFARWFASTERVLKCIDTDTNLEWNKTPFQLGGGVLTLGKESFPLQGAELEMLTIVEHENLLAYSAKLTNGTTLDIGYELSGKLISVQGRKGDKLTHACELDR